MYASLVSAIGIYRYEYSWTRLDKFHVPTCRATRVRARDARIRAMQHRHQNRSISNEAIEPPTTNIIT
jgi:hypothetical protein